MCRSRSLRSTPPELLASIPDILPVDNLLSTSPCVMLAFVATRNGSGPTCWPRPEAWSMVPA